MKKTKSFMMLLLACVLCLGVAGCTSRDEDDDNETYHTRDYIIGIGKWNTDRVKKADGNWTDFPFGEGKSFTIEFFDKKNDNGARIFKSWENINHTDPKQSADEYEGSYTVNGKTVICTVDGKQHLRMFITSMENRELGATVTFYKQNVTFDAIMTRSW